MPTFVPKDGGCHSACTFAFIGGTQRYVVGDFGIHSMSADAGILENNSLAEVLDTFQGLSAILLMYTREMIGSTRMAEEALQFGSQGIGLVTDDLLIDWNIITYAMRPSQRVPASSGPLSRCEELGWLGENLAPRSVLCDNVAISRRYLEIGQMLEKLKGRPFASDIDTEQARFEKVWGDCTAPLGLSVDEWGRSNDTCVGNAVSARHSELAALVKYYDAIDVEPAKSGWKTAN